MLGRGSIGLEEWGLGKEVSEKEAGRVENDFLQHRVLQDGVKKSRRCWSPLVFKFCHQGRGSLQRYGLVTCRGV